MSNYSHKIQPLVTHMESLRGRLSTRGYDLELSPSGGLTLGGSRGVTLAATSPAGNHTFEVEEAGSADHYVTVTVDGIVRSKPPSASMQASAARGAAAS